MKKKIRYLTIFFTLLLFSLYYIESGYPGLHNKQDRKGRVYWHGPRNERKIALTFDDGPSEYTSKILDILKKYNVKAAFFVVGMNAERYPDIIKREVQEGHILGNHSYSHPDMQIEIPNLIKKQFDKTEEVVKNITGLELYLFRPPYGVDNPWVFKEAEERGYVIIKWSISGEDWETKRADKVAKRITKNTQNGSIILLHDGRRLKRNPDCRSTLGALPIIINYLLKKGYQFVTIPELLEIENKWNNKSCHPNLKIEN